MRTVPTFPFAECRVQAIQRSQVEEVHSSGRESFSQIFSHGAMLASTLTLATRVCRTTALNGVSRAKWAATRAAKAQPTHASLAPLGPTRLPLAPQYVRTALLDYSRW